MVAKTGSAFFFLMIVTFATQSMEAYDSILIAQVVNANSVDATTRQREQKSSFVETDAEAHVLEMVQSHLPEVKALLDQLRQKAPKKYDLAIRDLARSARRLQIAKKRSAEAFELELHVVQAQSAINLLIAKLRLRDSPEDRKALENAAKQLADAELEKMKFDLAIMKARVARMQQQISDTESKIDNKESEFSRTLRRDLQIYLRKAGRK